MEPAGAAATRRWNPRTHAWHMSCSGRKVSPAVGACQSRASNAATTPSCSASGTMLSGLPGWHRSSNSALVCSSRHQSWISTVPWPRQARSPSASCSASSCAHPTFSTRSRPDRSRAGATHAVRPPGSNGAPTLSPHRSASMGTVSASCASHRRRPGDGSSSTARAKAEGTARVMPAVWATAQLLPRCEPFGWPGRRKGWRRPAGRAIAGSGCRRGSGSRPGRSPRTPASRAPGRPPDPARARPGS
jgi:hypothetical protein